MYKEKLLKSRDEIDHLHNVMEEYSKYAYICTVHKASKLADVVCRRVVGKLFHTHAVLR